MGRFQVLICSCFVVLLLSSCCVSFLKKFYTTEYGRYRPKKNRFKLPKESGGTYFNEDRVYTRIDSAYGENPGTGVIKLSVTKSFDRYFKTGQYLYGTTGEYLPGIKKDSNFLLKRFNNLKSGIVGYYKIQGDKIIHEYFLVTAQNCGAYYRVESKIIGDSIVGYERVKIEGLTGTPDW